MVENHETRNALRVDLGDLKQNYPLPIVNVCLQAANLNKPWPSRKFVDLAILRRVIFQFAMLVYQRVHQLTDHDDRKVMGIQGWSMLGNFA